MKSIVALCLLVIFCIVNAIPIIDDLESLRYDVRNAIYSVDNLIFRLDRLRAYTEEDTDRTVNDKLNEEEDSYREYRDSFLKDIRNKVNDAKDKGKEATDVDNCYREAFDGIENNEKTAKDVVTECINAAESSIKNNLGFLDNLIETGHTLISKLNDVFLDCHDIDISKKKSCIVAEVDKIMKDVTNLENNISSAETVAVPLSNNVIKQAANCIKNAYSPVYSTSITIKIYVQQCIDNVKDEA